MSGVHGVQYPYRWLRPATHGMKCTIRTPSLRAAFSATLRVPLPPCLAGSVLLCVPQSALGYVCTALETISSDAPHAPGASGLSSQFEF